MKKIKFNKNSRVAVGVVSLVLGFVGLVIAATAINLGTADNFAILAGTGITIGGAVNTSAITGDIGDTSATITGIGNAVLTGTNHSGDATTVSAKSALTTAYLAAEAQLPRTTVYPAIHDLGGETLTPGIYNDPSSFAVTGTLTLNGQGDPNAVFIFQAGSTLTTAGASNISLIGSAQACNVFWQVGSSATLGSASTFKGNILALTSIGLGTTANVEGRVLAQNGAVTLNGSNIITKATCVAPPPAPAVSSGGGGSFAILPLINVTKVPSPLALPAGPGLVTYTYKATNIGVVPMIGAWVKDDKCSDVKYVSGDTNNNGRLSVGESWTYTCTKMVSQTETNTATAHGQSNGWDVYDTANATVVVGLPAQIVPPLIHLVKTPSVFNLPAGGGAVTYSYAVTNPGTAPLSDVSIVDDKCTGLPGRVVGHPGDLNKNNLLESNETWQFTCQTNITQTTTNIGTAEGHANGLTAIDFSPSTVVVAAPGLPNTGFPSEGNGTPWNIVIVTSILGLASLAVVLRKRIA